MNPYPLIQGLAWLLTVFVWTYVYAQRRSDEVNRAFLAFAAVGGAWGGVELLSHLSLFRGFEDVIVRVIVPLWVPVGFLFLNFAYRLVGRRPDGIYWASLAATTAGVFVDLCTDWILMGGQRFPWGIGDIRDPVTHTVLCVVPVASSLYGAWLVFDYWRRIRDPNVRGPLLLVLIGGISTLSLVSVLNIVLPNFFGLWEFPRIGSAALGMFIYVVYLAVRKYNFLSLTIEHVAEELFEDVRDGIVLVNRQGYVLRMNRAAEQMLGVGPDPGDDLRMVDLLPSYEASADFDELLFDVTRNGETRHISGTQSTNSREGIDLGKILVIRDITEQRRAAEVLRRSNEELEQEVRRRSEELRQAQKLEAIGTLAGGIAHDFNNLLAAILGFSSAARDDLPTEHPIRADLDEVIQAARRARDIVAQLLTFSRRDEPQRKKVEVRQVLEEALKLLQVSLPATISITKDIDVEQLYVVGDPTQLNQVFMNLCTNAYQAMKRTGGELGLSLELVRLDAAEAAQHTRLAPGSYARIRVSDSGHGMSRELQALIFDPFFTTKPAGEGTGLGLATVQRIVEEHQGAIIVESQEGRGSTFEVLLPTIARDSIPPDSAQDLLPPAGTERVMVVDDKEQIARVGRRLLEPLGYRVSTFVTPEEALEEFRRDPGAFDLVITDQVMPGLSGLSLAGEMLRIKPELPVLLISGTAGVREQREAEAIGVRMFLPKPLTKAKLAMAVRKLLDERP